jgi:hypothetical protein
LSGALPDRRRRVAPRRRWTAVTGSGRAIEAQLIRDAFGPIAERTLRLYPFSGYPSPYNAAYAIGAIFTDIGVIGNIGGCPNQELAESLSQRTRTFFYQFDDRHAPPLDTNLPDTAGVRWGAFARNGGPRSCTRPPGRRIGVGAFFRFGPAAEA